MKPLSIIILLSVLGCQSKPRYQFTHEDSTTFCFLQPDSVLRNPRFQDSIFRLVWHDSAVQAQKKIIDSLEGATTEGMDKRYFLVSYATVMVDDYKPIQGCYWFWCDGFPSKRELDSIVYQDLIRPKKCYQHIIIQSIYEFKNLGDFISFGRNYPQEKQRKKEKTCCDKHSYGLFYGNLKQDSINFSYDSLSSLKQ